MDAKDLKSKMPLDSIKILVAKKKKRGGYTVFPQVVDVVRSNVPLVGDSYVIVFED